MAATRKSVRKSIARMDAGMVSSPDLNANSGPGKAAPVGTRHKLMMQAMVAAEPDGPERITSASEQLQAVWISNSVHGHVLAIVTSSKFDVVMAAVVSINLIIMVLETEYPDIHDFSTNVDWVFNVIYTVEACMRWSVYRRVYFMSAVNILDITIVIVGWVTSLAEVINSSSSSGFLNSFGALKVLRALRALRLFRMISFFEEIWIVFSSFLNVLKPMMWTVVFITIILFIFAMFAVELIGTNATFDGVDGQENFKSTVPAITTLFQVMTLDEWRGIMQPLAERQWWCYIFFWIFICIAALALMNLVTAVVVQNSMEHMSSDEDLARDQLLMERELHVEQISDLLSYFHCNDEIQDAYRVRATPAELLKARGSWEVLEEILNALDVHEESEVRRLFQLLDHDGSGSISIGDFLDGLLDLRSVTEDKHRLALIKAMDHDEHKFAILERSVAVTRAPSAVAASLSRISKWLHELGLVGKDEEDVEDELSSRKSGRMTWQQNRRSLTSTRTSSPKSGSKGSIREEPRQTNYRLRSTASHRDPIDNLGIMEVDELSDSSDTPLDQEDLTGQVLHELRLFRSALQHQGRELEEQAAAIEKMHQSVASMQKSLDASAQSPVGRRHASLTPSSRENNNDVGRSSSRWLIT